jgi:hypothetical protein
MRVKRLEYAIFNAYQPTRQILMNDYRSKSLKTIGRLLEDYTTYRRAFMARLLIKSNEVYIPTKPKSC